MKKVIDGKLCDTKTAEYICGYRHLYRGEFDHVDEDLYRTKSGTFFIHGEGGARTIYAKTTETGGRSDGEALRIIDEASARAFVERHGDADDYVRCFGQPEEA